MLSRRIQRSEKFYCRVGLMCVIPIEKNVKLSTWKEGIKGILEQSTIDMRRETSCLPGDGNHERVLLC